MDMLKKYLKIINMQKKIMMILKIGMKKDMAYKN